MSVKVSRILHAGYVLEFERAQIAFDPIFENPFSVNCHAFPPVRFALDSIRALTLDAVFISHYHDDHCSLESLALLNRHTPIYIFCIYPEMAEMIRALGFLRVEELVIDQAVMVAGFSVTPRRALDEDVDSIFEIRVGGFNILNVVDAWIDAATMEQLTRISRWDLILWPFQIMRELEVIAPGLASTDAVEFPLEWREQIRALDPRFIVPSSCQFQLEPWSWMNAAFFPMTYDGFAQEMKKLIPQAGVLRLDPGESIQLDHSGALKSERLRWIEPLGPQDVDYHYVPQLIPPPTSEIAAHFHALTPAEARRVSDYCERGLLEAFRALPDRIARESIWKLSTFDRSGGATSRTYKISGSSIEMYSGDACATWTTEVVAAKLHAAFERGESLTSMYVRVVADGIELADVVDDPLISSLFTGVFGAYQAAQLKGLRRQRNQCYKIKMARVLYGDGEKIGDVEDWQQRQEDAVYKTFLGKTALLTPANVECTFTSPKPLKRKMQLMIIEDGQTQLNLTTVRVIEGTQVIAKIREQKPLPPKNKK